MAPPALIAARGLRQLPVAAGASQSERRLHNVSNNEANDRLLMAIERPDGVPRAEGFIAPCFPYRDNMENEEPKRREILQGFHVHQDSQSMKTKDKWAGDDPPRDDYVARGSCHDGEGFHEG